MWDTYATPRGHLIQFVTLHFFADYSMRDVEAFHQAQARAAAGPDVFNGEGPGEPKCGAGDCKQHSACAGMHCRAVRGC